MWEVYADWDNDRFACRETLSTDGLNLLPNPVSLEYRWMPYGLTETIGRRIVHTNYGLKVWTIQTTSGNNEGLFFNIDGTGTSDVPAVAGRRYHVSLWVRRMSQVGGSGSHEFYLEAEITGNQQGITTVLNSSLSSNWLRVNLTFIAADTGEVGYSFRKGSNSGVYGLEIAGIMITEDASGFANGFNAGHVSNAYDRITGFITGEFNWQLGRRPFETMADESATLITLSNGVIGFERWFSPEFTGHPLEGLVKPFRQVIIENNGVRRWTGYTDGFRVATTRFANEPVVNMSCSSMKTIYQRVFLPCPLYIGKRVDEILTDLIMRAKAQPNFQSGVFILDDPIYGTLDDNFLGDLGFAVSQEIVPIYGDNQQDFEGTLPNLWELITGPMDLEAGGFWFDENANPRFTPRGAYQALQVVSIHINDAQEDTVYYTADEDSISRVEVETYIRKPSTDNANLVFSLPSALTIAANEVVTFVGQFRDTEGLPIGATDIKQPSGNDLIWQIGGGNVQIELFGAAVIITVTGGQNGGVLTTLNVRGRTYDNPYPITVIAENPDLLNDYGDRVLKISTKAVGSVKQAQSLANFRLWQRDWFLGRIEQITLSEDYTITTGNLHLPIESFIRVTEYMSAHTGTYRVTGALHSVNVANGQHTVTYWLEPSPIAWQLDTGHQIDEDGLRIGIPA